MASVTTKKHKSFSWVCVTFMGDLCQGEFKPRRSWGRRCVLGKDGAAAVTNGCSSQQRFCCCCCCVCETRQEWSITPPPQTLIPHRLGLMAVWWEKRTRRRLALVKNRGGGGTFCDSGIAKQNVTHLVTWQHNVSSCRLDGAEWRCDAKVTAAQKPKKKNNRQAESLDDV